MRPNRIRHKLDENQTVFGVNMQMDAPWLVEMVGVAGFDFAMLDGEHGVAFNNLPALIMAADAAGITPIVRVPSHERGYLLPALEAGAGGVQVPMVNTADQARFLVQETKYAPLGERGFSNATRAANYGAVDTSDYVKAANRETLLVVQLETKEALQNAGEIAQVPGVDMIFFGPGDLSQAFRRAGEMDADVVRSAIKQAIKDIDNRVPVSTTAFSTDDVRYWQAEGVQTFLTSSIHTIRMAFEDLWGLLERGTHM